MTDPRRQRIEFGDFQTPDELAIQVCERLAGMGINPEAVIEPTCGVGAFVIAACKAFPKARDIYCFEVNQGYLATLKDRIAGGADANRVHPKNADFFTTDWQEVLGTIQGTILVVGNFPWVTSSVQGSIGGTNMPQKSNFQGHEGFDAISGKANFDISEWMLLEVLRWFKGRKGDVAMLVKTSVARKVLAHAERQACYVEHACIVGIDAKKSFGAAVEACLLVIRLSADSSSSSHDYTVFKNMEDTVGKQVGHRNGLTVGDLEAYEACAFLVGKSPQKWRSGVKHDASAVMEFTRTNGVLKNGLGEIVDLEMDFLFPLLKGSDIGSDKPWREKFVLITQRSVGESTAVIEATAPKTWTYLTSHAEQLDSRGSTIYAKNPRFSIFGIGDYAFRPWRIAICGLYKVLRFRLVEPIENRPVMFDDTVYYLSFGSEQEARATLEILNSEPCLRLLASLIFWDEKRPIKTGILNVLDWSRLGSLPSGPQALPF